MPSAGECNEVVVTYSLQNRHPLTRFAAMKGMCPGAGETRESICDMLTMFGKR